jgi:hypothetical protein
MTKTNAGMVAYCEKALAEKWFYGWGAYGQKATAALVDSLIKQYPSMNTKRKDYMLRAVAQGTRLSDCYGLVKGYLFQQDDGSLKYDASKDLSSGSAYSRAKEKGALSSMPEIPGLILHMQGHAGVYCGNGRFIECAGGEKGIRAGRISGGKVIEGSLFTSWFKDANLSYEDLKAKDEQAKAIDAVVIKPSELPLAPLDLPVIFENKEFTVKAVLIEGRNYVELRPLLEILRFYVEQLPYENVPVIYSGGVDAQGE